MSPTKRKAKQSGPRATSIMDNVRNRLPISAEEALRNKQRAVADVSIKRPLSSGEIALADTTNLPSKRQRLLLDNYKGNNDSKSILSGMNNGRKALVVAPDWGGGEITSTAVPFNDGGNVPSTPADFRDTTNALSLSHPKWSLKREVVIGFESSNISTMYTWQSECLTLPGLLTGERNLVYIAPTSAGKSLVADILTIRKVVTKREKAIIVVPYIAMVQEKTKFLKKVLGRVKVQAEKKGEWDKSKRWRELNIVGFHSGARNRIGWDELDVAVCTIEKANVLINASIENCTINHLGIIVLDELHMLNDSHRGHILELLATKILCLTDEQIQIVGMSASLANMDILARWLRAEFYECTYRPIPLCEYFVYENNVYDTTFKLTARIPPSEIKELKDPVTNAIVTLTLVRVNDGHGVLIFCQTRKRCEEFALLVTKFMPPCDKETEGKRIEVISDLATTAAGLDPVLEKTVFAGVAFHHSGLTSEEKDLIVDSYDNGLVKVICCTATMAAGVNLPARRVIISPRVGRDFVSPTMLLQMKGRAGRKGRDTVGENFVVCRKEDVESVKAIMEAEMPSVSSCLAGDGSGLKRAMLEGIATKLATTTYSLDIFLRTTLLYHTTATPVTTLRPLITAAIASLEESDLITCDNDTGCFEATMIGRATVTSGLGPDEGIFLHKELCRALKAFNLESDMHIVYQFTPIHSSSSTNSIEVDWMIMRDEVEKLDESALRAATFVGVNPGFVNRMALGGTLREDTPANIEKARVYRRFYVALMLRELINERPVHEVAKSYDIARGFIQQLATTCRSFATTSTTFCKVMGWTGLALLLEHYSSRLDFGVKEDLIGLARIPFVKSFTARIFHENGLKTVAAVANSEMKDLVRILERAQPTNLRLREEEEKMKQRLEERADIILKASRRIYKQDCSVELEE